MSRLITPFLHSFISPVSGRILCTTDYILVGDQSGAAYPSPVLIDLQLELIQLRQKLNLLKQISFIIGYPNEEVENAQALSNLGNGFVFNTGGIVSTVASVGEGVISLSEGKLLIGGSDGLATETQLINMDNLPGAPYKHILRANISGRLVAVNDLTGLEDDFHDTKASLLSQIGDLASVVNALSNTVDAIDSTVDAIETGLGLAGGVFGFIGIVATLAGLAGAIKTNSNDIDDLEDDVGVLQGRVDNIDIEITNINTSITIIQGRIDNLRLNNIFADAAVSFHGQRLISLADPIDPTDGVNLRTLESAIDTFEITLEGDVTGTGTIGEPIETELVLTLDEIKLAEDTVNLNNQKISNLKTDEVEQQDALNAKFLWDLMHGNVEVVWV